MDRESMKGPSAEKSKNKEPMDLLDIVDTIEHCNDKINFIGEIFQRETTEESAFSQKARAGFQCIMFDIEDDLQGVSNQLMEISRKARDRGKTGSDPSTK